MIKIRNLSVNYGKKQHAAPALKDLNLDIAAGESVAIMGQSGHGKSTLLAVLGGMLNGSAGEYSFRGTSVPDLSGQALTEFRGKEVGFVFQNFFLLPHLTLLENVLVPMQHLSVSTQEKIARAHTLFEQVGIAGLEQRFPSEISGGQAQRAAIARALMRNPPLILADEPTGSLDEESAENIINLLLSLTDAGTTVVVVTHSEQVAQRLGRIVRIEAGRIATPDATLQCA